MTMQQSPNGKDPAGIVASAKPRKRPHVDLEEFDKHSSQSLLFPAGSMIGVEGKTATIMNSSSGAFSQAESKN